jgi:hypothetical protein
MVMGSMAWRCIRWGVKPHLVLHTPPGRALVAVLIQPGRAVPIATAMVMGCMAWRCNRRGVKPHLVLHTPQAVPWWRC